MYLFSTRAGQLFIAEDGNTGEFNSIWQRFARKEVDASVERFTEQSLRVKVALDVSLEECQSCLGILSTRTLLSEYTDVKPDGSYQQIKHAVNSMIQLPVYKTRL